MEKNISNNKRKELKKKAYSLKPIIMIGQNGLTDAVKKIRNHNMFKPVNIFSNQNKSVTVE